MDVRESRSSRCRRADDLTRGVGAILLWCLPIAALIVGVSRPRVRDWLWIPAFLVMSVGCLINAARCGRLHCYVTAPLFFLAAVYVALGQAHLVPMYPAVMLDAVACVTLLSFGLEHAFGRYTNPG